MTPQTQPQDGHELAEAGGSLHKGECPGSILGAQEKSSNYFIKISFLAAKQ